MPAVVTARFAWSGALLGFSLGGFFDGILLHQILQWHHLLSSLEGEAFRDIRVQILADGLFHALMYVVAAAGLWLLWRSRRDLESPNAGRVLLAHMLIGFGAWHVADGVVSHWLTGIHRIRIDSATPLLWDLVWFCAFGLVPLIAGWRMRHNGSGGVTRGSVAAAVAIVAVAGGAALSAMPAPNVSQVMVYFGPGASAAQAMAAARAVDARVIWSDSSGELWAFDLAEPGRSSQLYRHGAWFVGNRLFPVGCLAWSRAI